jgi:hypothetical protein
VPRLESGDLDLKAPDVGVDRRRHGAISYVACSPPAPANTTVIGPKFPRRDRVKGDDWRPAVGQFSRNNLMRILYYRVSVSRPA